MSDQPDYALLDRHGAASIFSPRPDPAPTPAGASDFRIEVEPGVAIGVRFYVHRTDAPTILYFHGNGEVASDHDDIARLYHDIGLNLFIAEFRGYGRSEGRPTFAHLVADAQPVAAEFHRYLDERGFGASRYVMGRSLGSQPALEIAARFPDCFSGLVIESGAAGMQRMLERFGISRSPEADHFVQRFAAKIDGIRLPSLIIHGAQDELVPMTQATDLRERLAQAGNACELLIIQGAGHNDLLWVGAKSYFDAIQDLVDATSR